MALIGKDPVVLGTSYSTIYTVSSGKLSRWIQITLVNTSGADAIPSINFCPASATPGAAGNVQYELVGGTTSKLGSGEDRDFMWYQHAEQGDFIEWKCDTATAITAFISAREIDDDTTNRARYKWLDAAYLPNSATQLAVVGANVQMSMIHAIVHNQDVQQRLASLYLVPSAGAPAAGNALFGHVAGGYGELLAGEYVGRVKNPNSAAGTEIWSGASAGSAVVYRYSWEEATT